MRSATFPRFRIAVLGLCAALLLPFVSFAESSASATGQVISARTLSRLLITDVTRVGRRLVAVGEHGYILLSDDDGASWTRATNARRTMLTGVRFADAQHGWVTGHDGVILASSDGGANWAEQRFAPDEEKPLLALWFKDTSTGIAIGAYGLYLETRDGGNTWTEREILQALLGDDGADRHLNAIAGFGDGRLVIAGEAGTLLTSPDAGVTWAAQTAPYQGSYFGALRLPGDALLIYGLRGQAFRSDDGGVNWVAAEGAGPVTLLGGGSLDDGTVVLVGAAGTIRISRDGGRHFAAQASENPSAFSSALPLAADRVLIVGEAGVRIDKLPVATAELGAKP